MTGNEFVCIDLGASGTRVTGRDTIVHEIPNNIREVAPDEDTHLQFWDMGTFEETLMNALDITIIREEGANMYVPAEQRVLVGPLADRYGSTSRPSGLDPKHKQPINYTNAIIATACEIMLSPGMQFNTTAVNDVKLFVALPPIECKGNEKILQENLLGTYRVQFNELQREFRFRVADVFCNSESLLSLYTFFFNENTTARAESMQYKGKNVLSIDIGASTEDNAVMSNGRYIDKSGQTISIGGNQIRDFIITSAQSKYGYTPSVEEAEYVVHTGRIKIGNTEEDFSPQLRRAKEEFSIQLLNQLDGYFKQIGMSLASFACVVVGGGGSLHSSVKVGDAEQITTPALSEIIMERLKKTCPSVDVLPVPGNPRHANIKGLLVLAIMWVNSLQRKQAQTVQQPYANPIAGKNTGRAPESFVQSGMGTVAPQGQQVQQTTINPGTPGYTGGATWGQV